MKGYRISNIESFLDTMTMVKNPIAIFEQYRKKIGPTFEFRFGGLRKTIVTADPDFLKYILKDNNDNYHKSHIQVKRFVEFQGRGLTSRHGDYWKRQRELLSMGFNRSRLTEIFPIQLQVLKDFMTDFDKAVNKGPVEIHDQMVKFTLRSVGKSLFGSQMKEKELEGFANAISEIQSFIVKKVVQPYLFPWYAISGQNRKYQEMRQAGDQIVKNYVDKRRKEMGKESDVLQIMLETPYRDTGEFMDDEIIMVEILQLLVAGNETSTTASTWTFYQLAKHPEHIKAIRAEIKSVFGNGEIDFNGIRQLKYTINVLNEAMRMNPPFWIIDREALKDDEYKGIKIPAGTTVIPYIYGAHHNKNIWEDAETFNPSRFDKEHKKHPPFAFIPFGGGPRVCIGQNMALMQILLVMCAVIQKYDFKLTDDKDIGFHAMMLLKPDGPINLKFTPVS